jgi:TonB family protein
LNSHWKLVTGLGLKETSRGSKSLPGGLSRRHLLLGGAVLVLHLLVLIAFNPLSVRTQIQPGDSSTPMVMTLISHAPAHAAQTVPLPKLSLPAPKFDLNTLTAIAFQDPDWDVVPGVIGASSAPQLAPDQWADPKLYAQRAGLSAGQSATVLLSLEIRTDGTVGQFSVLVSCGDSMIDQQAIRYALSLQWIPGSVRRHAHAMRVQFPVTLSIPA